MTTRKYTQGRIGCVLFLVAFLFLNRDAVAAPTGTPAANEILINETIGFQRTDGVGACSYTFPHASDIGWNWDDVSFVFDELELRYIRLAPWFGFWESANDNADPNAINRDGFGIPNDFYHWHDLPFAPSNYDELSESITAYVSSLETDGVPQRVAEVQNEPAIEASIRYPSAESLRDAALALIEQLDRHGQSATMLHGPNFHTPRGTAAWAQVWLADAALR